MCFIESEKLFKADKDIAEQSQSNGVNRSETFQPRGPSSVRNCFVTDEDPQG